MIASMSSEKSIASTLAFALGSGILPDTAFSASFSDLIDSGSLSIVTNFE